MQNPDKMRLARQVEDFAVLIYDFTMSFPAEERFTLTAQLRRAAISIGSNYFEGCGRKSNRSLASFLYNSVGSANEIEFQLRVARRRHFGDNALYRIVQRELITTRRMIYNLIRQLETPPE